MVNFVEKRLGRTGKARRKLVTRVVTSAQGKRVQALRVDAQSDSFGEDLLTSFERSVGRARRENKAIFGHGNGPEGDDDK